MLSRTLFFCLAWAAVGTIAFARQYFDRLGLDGRLLPAYAEWLVCYLPWGLLSAVVLPLEQRFPLDWRPGWLRSLGALALASVPLAYAAYVMTAGLAIVVAAMTGQTGHAAFTWAMPGRDLLGHELLYWTAVAGAAVLRTFVDARDAERRASRLLVEKAQLESTLRQAELDALRMRLQPHFLFNSLQNISVLTQHDPATASRMLTRLGDLLRASLARDREAETTLATEIALTRAYLAVEEMRFGDRLTSTVEVGPDLEAALVPTFLLQPIVENAIRHGLDVAGRAQRGLLTIQGAREGDALVLTVRDNGVGVRGDLRPDAYGVGLGATCQRLARLYPQRHAFVMRPLPEGGTEVRVTLPFHLAPSEVVEHAHAAGADRGR
jgi:hypothetical protein